MVPASDSFESLEGAALFGEDGISGLGPDEGLGIGVVAVEIVVDRLLELGNAPEDAAPDAFGRDLGEEALDEIEPGRARRREVQLEAPMLGEPLLHLGRLVRSVVVEHQVDVEVLLQAPVDPLQEADELFRTGDAAATRR